MILNGARGMGATHTRTRVNAVLVNTGKVAGTLCVYHTLGFTFDVGVPLVVPDAGARRGSVDFVAHGVDTAR